MELIETDRERNQGPLPEPEPRYQTANPPVKKSQHGHAWIRIAVATVLAVILVILIVLLARWIYHKAHNHATPSTPVSQNTPSASSSKTPANSSPSASSGNGSSNTGSSSSGSSSSSSSNSGSSGYAAKTQTPNTGPGNVVAIFVGASLVAGGLHYLISVRRFARNS